jgi:hypothetical protein
VCIALAGVVGAACGGGSALTPQEQTAVVQMERALEAARAAQERFYAREGFYTTDPDRLDIPDTPGQSALVLERAGADAYVVSATHPSTEWVCFLVQQPNRPFYTRCGPPGALKDE